MIIQFCLFKRWIAYLSIPNSFTIDCYVVGCRGLQKEWTLLDGTNQQKMAGTRYTPFG